MCCVSVLSVEVGFILRAAFENGFVNAVEDDCFDEGDWVFWNPSSGGEVESEGNGVISNFADVGDFDVVVLSAVALCGVVLSFGAHYLFLHLKKASASLYPMRAAKK